MKTIESIATRFATPVVHWIALLGLCAAYLQGGIVKATDFSGAIAEIQHFGLAPAAPIAIAVIVLELGASAMILTGIYRWLAALALGGFTLIATLIALRFWELPAAKSGSWPRMPSSSISAWSVASCSWHGTT